MKPIDSFEHFRSFSIFFIFISLYGIIIGNLYNIQVKKQDFFMNLAQKQYNINITTLPERAQIFDKNNTPIALNKDSYAAFILPKEVIDRTTIQKFLQEHFPAAAQRLISSWDKNFFFISRKLTKEEEDLINQSNITDIHILQEPSRFYPNESLSTVIGITDIDNHGIMGLEQQYDEILHGTPTTHTLKKDARKNHFYFEKELAIQGAPSKSIQLTIDADLQYKINNILKEAIINLQAKEGAAVVMDPITGEISAMVSYPYFDPNDVQNLDMESTKNRTVSQAFETGSVIKPFCALAALEEEVVTIDEMINCENTKETKIDGIRVRTVVPHGTISFLEIIQNSNNIGTVKVAKRINTKLYDYYKLLGFGMPTGLKFPGEQKGYVNPPEKWSAYSIVSLSFGYEITTTLLQLARSYSLIYNGGQLVTPKLVYSQNKEETQPQGPVLISQRTRDDLDTILEASIMRGSGKRARIKNYKTTGKTGTSNILDNGKYNEKKHLNTFIGYVGKDDYKRVIAVYVKESKTAMYASTTTAPLFRKIAEALLLHDHILA